MISIAHILDWQSLAPWPNTQLVEHDLILTRAICELYQNPVIQENLVFRGGTALHKLFFNEAGRFSEDLDFVQLKSMPIGQIIDAIRSCLDSWLGKPKWMQNQGRFTLYYQFETEAKPVINRKVKIEINTREHFNCYPIIKKPFSVKSEWYSSSLEVTTYSIEELLGTKLRALYQRKKGRDLYDFWYVTKHYPSKIDHESIIKTFQEYMKFSGQIVTRAEFEKNIMNKSIDNVFINDIFPLLATTNKVEYDQAQAFNNILIDFIARLPGESWKGAAS